MKVLRVYHAGRDAAHRARERALVAAGIDVTLVVPRAWPGGEAELSQEPFRMVELDVARPGDVNRHRYRDPQALARVLADVRPDLLDVHEEPFSVAARQWLRAAPQDLPVVMYTAQNVDKRFPPPFHQWEKAAHRRVAALYPCTRQAASVARGKGFAGRIDVLPLGYDDALFRPGEQSLDDAELVLAFAGRLVPEKGVEDAIRVLAAVARVRPARLVVCGEGPVTPRGDGVEFLGRVGPAELARVYRSAHVVLVPSRPTATWTEQFGRVIVEAQASGAVVAGYDSGSIREVGGDAALLAPTGDVDALAALVLGLDDFESRRSAGLELAAERTWQRVAERQAALYREPKERLSLPRSPRKRRELARAEFGATAATTAGTRPFALRLR
ncbi:MAG TPA: glycosyltransferase family 4 protein [Gaiellaceae bacterium]|nr:glycosyltransferase family 4 protein [Gaiellaceae bacterium]